MTYTIGKLPLNLKKRKVKVAFSGQTHPTSITAEEFYERTSYRFVNSLEFDSASLYREVKEACRQKFSQGKISQRAEWLGIKWRNFLSKGFVEDVSLRWITDEVGFGLFAEKPLEANTFIGEYLGIVRKTPFLFGQTNPYCFRYPLYRMGLFYYLIDAETVGNEMSFINHSSHPNLEAVATLNDSIYHIGLRTIRPIAMHEELTYDYGNAFMKK